MNDGSVDDGARSPAASPTLLEVLTEARTLGFLGPGPIERQLRHAEGFVRVTRRLTTPGSRTPGIVDLGAGGGLPGLVLAEAWPEAHLVLLEANGRRAAFLAAGVRRLDLEARVEVLEARAEIAGRLEERRGSYDGVVARSFGPPAVVAECAAPLLRTGGWLVVSEPPPQRHGGGGEYDSAGAGLEGGLAEPGEAGESGESDGRTGGDDGNRRGPDGRWPRAGLALLGLEAGEPLNEGFEYQVLRQVLPCPERFPRRNGVPAKRPLF
jgi:16S rRNA (guanine527-N7)-methyltransferase